MSKSELARLSVQVPEIAALRKSVQAARDYIAEATGGAVGGGEAPVEFLIASHRALVRRDPLVKELIAAAMERYKYDERGRVNVDANKRFRLAVAALK